MSAVREEGVCPVRIRGILNFLKFMVCPLEQGGLFSADKGGKFFAILCGRLLWTPPPPAFISGDSLGILPRLDFSATISAYNRALTL